MNRQRTLANASTFGKYKKPTRREKFLAEMEQVVPCKDFYRLVELFLPEGGERTPSLERQEDRK